eukprot:186348_1
MPQQKVAYNGCYDFSSNHHSHSHSHHSVPNNEGGFHSIPEMQRARQQMKTYRRKLKLETITNTEYKHYMNLQQRMKPRWMKHKKQYLPPKCIYDDADADACNGNVDQICKDIGELELFDSMNQKKRNILVLNYEDIRSYHPKPHHLSMKNTKTERNKDEEITRTEVWIEKGDERGTEVRIDIEEIERNKDEEITKTEVWIEQEDDVIK